jgi:hypothetical protein
MPSFSYSRVALETLGNMILTSVAKEARKTIELVNMLQQTHWR